MKMRKFLAAGLCLLVMAGVFTGCNRKVKDSGPKRITIAFQSWVGYGLFYLARDKGFCADEGIDLIIVDEQLDSARADAFKGFLDPDGPRILHDIG